MNEAAKYRGQHGEYALEGPSPFAFGRASACFRARDSNGKLVCLKEFTQPPVADSGREGTSEFLAEVAARSHLAHANILPILDHGVLDGRRGSPFIVMPLCDFDLRTTMRGRAFVPLPAALNILKQVATAIDFAHSAGLLHGDIKPENILFIKANSHVFLSDFGTSRFFTYNEPMMTASRGAPPGGTTAYLSPEQIEHNTQTARSDIYSFGTVAFEMLSGGLPIDLAMPAFRQMQAKVQGKLRDAREMNPGLSEPVAAWLAKGLSLDANERPATAMALCAGLEANVAPAAAQVQSAQVGPVPGPVTQIAKDTDPPAVGRTWADLVAQLVSPRGAAALIVILAILVVFAHWQAAPGSVVQLFGVPLWHKAGADDATKTAPSGVTGPAPAGSSPAPVASGADKPRNPTRKSAVKNEVPTVAVTSPTVQTVTQVPAQAAAPPAPAVAPCRRPNYSSVHIPNGYAATREEMLGGVERVGQFGTEGSAYLECLRKAIDAQPGLDGQLKAELEQGYKVADNEIAREALALTGRMNQQVKYWKERHKADL